MSGHVPKRPGGQGHTSLDALSAIAARRVVNDSVARRELARVIHTAERGMLRVIDRWAARARRERGAA